MSEELIVIRTLIEFNHLFKYISDKEFVAYDIETTGLTTRDEIIGYSICAEENKSIYVVLSEWDAKEQKLIRNEKLIEHSKEFLEYLKINKLIMHNGVFDCMITEAFFKVSLIESLHTDTMILAHLLDENRYVGLKELALQYFGESSTEEMKLMKASIVANGGSVTKELYELYKGDSQLIAKYGAKDAILTLKLFYQLVPELYDQGLDQFFYEDESMPQLRGPTYELNTTGLALDQDRLTTLKKTLQTECEEAKAYIMKEITPHIKTKYPGIKKKDKFNMGSSSQRSWLMFGVLELEFGTLTKGGKTVCKQIGIKLPYTATAKRNFIHECSTRATQIYQPEATVNGKLVKAKKVRDPWYYIACDKATMKKLAPRHKWIERMLEYDKKMKLLSTYIEGMEARVQYGIIHPSFLQHGTTSGRYASRNPNLQNLPRDDKRIKECFIARPGKIFVGADQSQLEPRTFAFYSQDERLMKAFEGADDFYSVIGMNVYGKTDCIPRKEGSPDAFGVKYKKLRDLSKVIALASTYGATAHQLAPTTGKSIEDTQQDIDNYFEEFPGVRQYQLDAHAKAKSQGYVTNLFGRKRRMPDALKINKIYGKKEHADYPYEVRNVLNLAVNHPIQSTGASIMNRAAIKFRNNRIEAGIDCKIVCQVHDSLIIECSETDADTVSLLLQDAMETAVELKGIKFEAIPKIGRNLSEV